MGVSDANATPSSSQANSGGPGARFQKLGRKILLAVAILVLAFGVWVANVIFVQHNFHVVSPGMVYRSAQVSADDLTRMIQGHGIKSILNLRGGAQGGVKEWYYAETNAALKLGVQYYDYQLSASHELTDAEMEKLVNMVRNAPKPLLIHCKSGADRTGLVGALYLYSVEGKPAETADHELKLLYGHVPYLFWRNTIAMDHSFWRYVNDHAPATGAGSRKLASPLTKSEASAVSAN